MPPRATSRPTANRWRSFCPVSVNGAGWAALVEAGEKPRGSGLVRGGASPVIARLRGVPCSGEVVFQDEAPQVPPIPLGLTRSVGEVAAMPREQRREVLVLPRRHEPLLDGLEGTAKGRRVAGQRLFLLGRK